jgi:hypothetical protein
MPSTSTVGNDTTIVREQGDGLLDIDLRRTAIDVDAARSTMKCQPGKLRVFSVKRQKNSRPACFQLCTEPRKYATRSA